LREVFNRKGKPTEKMMQGYPDPENCLCKEQHVQLPDHMNKLLTSTQAKINDSRFLTTIFRK